MKEQIQSVLDMVGLDHKIVQVLESPFDDSTVIYPNYMQTRLIKDDGITEEELLDELEQMMIEHMLDVQHDLKMIKRYKELLK